MKRLTKHILIALLPGVFTLGVAKVAVAVGGYLGCPPGKYTVACSPGGLGLSDVLNFIAWWGAVLWMPGVAISGFGALAAFLVWAAPRSKHAPN